MRLGSRQSVRHHLDNVPVLADADDRVHLRDFLFDFLLITLGQAAGHHHRADGSLLLELGHFQNVVNGFLFGVFNKAAGVDNDGIRLVHIGDDLKPCLSELCQHHFPIHQVFGTSQRNHSNLMIHPILLYRSWSRFSPCTRAERA